MHLSIVKFLQLILLFLLSLVLSGVFTDVQGSLREIRDVLDENEAGERSLEEAAGKQAVPERPSTIAELRRDLEKYLEAHEKASFTNTELHRAMHLHISNLRLLGGPLDTLRQALPRPQISEGRCFVMIQVTQNVIL